MSAQVLFQDIASFLSESPEFVESWLNAPVKKKPSIDLPDFVVSIFNILPLEHFDTSLKLNRDWYKECKYTLAKRRNVCIKRYWDTVEEYKEARKALDECWENEPCSNPHYLQQCYTRCSQLGSKKFEDFGAWVDVDRAIIHCGFPELIDNINPNYYIGMHGWNLDPYEVIPEQCDILDYWGDEDPDA